MNEKTLELLLKRILQESLKDYPTKEDLGRFATKEDLGRFATKEDLGRFATKEDLGRFVTKEDLDKKATQIIEEIADLINDFIVEVDHKKADKEEVEKIEKRVTNLEDKSNTYLN